MEWAADGDMSGLRRSEGVMGFRVFDDPCGCDPAESPIHNNAKTASRPPDTMRIERETP